MNLKEATDKARIESLNGYVQHVQCLDHAVYGKRYIVSDWYDGTTVASFMNGKQL